MGRERRAMVADKESGSEDEEGEEEVHYFDVVTEDESVEESMMALHDGKDLSAFTSEALNKAALDTGCTSTVTGRKWLDIYREALPEESRKLLKGPYFTNSFFRCANNITMKSKGRYRVPVKVGKAWTSVWTEVVDIDIPMLMSLPQMRQFGMVIDTVECTAKVLGRTVELGTSQKGHYLMDLLGEEPEDVWVVCLETATDEEVKKALIKLHKQFGHRPVKSFEELLKNAGVWKPEMKKMLEKIVGGCEGCIKRKRKPDRPAVAMPAATDFNQKVAMDLSFYKGKTILHLVDMFTRYSISVVVKNKSAGTMVDAIMKNWCARYGVMEALLSDNGTEFVGEEMKEMKEMLNVVEMTTGVEAP